MSLGSAHTAPRSPTSTATVRRRVETKVIGPLLVAKHFEIRHSMTLFAGVVGWRPGPGSIVKGITNGAVDFAVRHLAATSRRPGQRDRAGHHRQRPWDGKGEAKPAFLAGAAEQTLVGRYGELDDVVDAAIWLLRSSYVDGQTIHVDGGRR